MIVGYRRVSSSEQNLDRQQLGSDVEKTFEEKISGSGVKRPQLDAMIEFIRESDEVRVWSVDRLGRSVEDLLSIIRKIMDKGASIKFVSQHMHFAPKQDANPMATMQLQMFAMFAEFEKAMIAQRRREGIEAAQKRGVYTGGKRRSDFDVSHAVELRMSGKSWSEIAAETGGKSTTIRRALAPIIEKEIIKRRL